MNEQDTDRAPNRDDVGELIRLAKRDSKISSARTERVRAAARKQWAEEVDRPRRGKIFWSVAAAAAVVAGIAFTIRSIPVTGDPGPIAIAAQVEQLEGHVETSALDGGAWNGLTSGDPIRAATALRTGTGRLSLRLNSGHGARVDRGSEVRFLMDGGVELASGRIYIDSGRNGEDSPLDLRTPFGALQEIGTQYEVLLNDDGLRLRIREGSVILHRPDNDLTINAGQELRVSSTRGTEMATIDTYGEAWSWVSEIAAIPNFQGRTTEEFLRWIAREKGWTLVFDNIDVANAAHETVLEGDLGRFTPDEALQIVATTSRLQHAYKDGVLTVSAER
jgi:ferric-dicitrate binding protein FerR (iron transport regulator)